MITVGNNSIYISTITKLPGEMPAAGMYKCLDMGIVIDRETGIIHDIGITLLTKESQDFIKEIVTGYSFNNGVGGLIEVVSDRYYGAARKAIMANIKILYERYLEITKKE